MTRPKPPIDLPLRAGVAASCVAVNGGPWPTVLDFFSARLPALSRTDWAARFAGGDVLDERGQPVPADAPCRNGQRLFYYRWLPNEPAPAQSEHIVFQDDWLVVADKPHFMPVTPSGAYVQRSLLVRLRQRLQLPHLSPLHRIDRETAGLVLFAVQPHTRAAYQALFRDRLVSKRYEAVAPHMPDLTFPILRKSRLEPEPERFFVSREVPGEPNSETHIELHRPLPPSANGMARALYRLRPVTGQRHQLRVHLNALGMPIEGDAFYPLVRHPPGAADDASQPLQLLARELSFIDPITGVRRHFVSSRTLSAAPAHGTMVQATAHEIC